MPHVSVFLPGLFSAGFPCLLESPGIVYCKISRTWDEFGSGNYGNLRGSDADAEIVSLLFLK